METEQQKVWKGKFGQDYTIRNTISMAEMEAYYLKNFGVSRVEMNKKFLGQMSADIRILEVGANTGNQLLCLQQMGFKNLFGIELQPFAVKKAKKRLKNITISTGSVFDISFPDKYFDLVFTSGVLIHLDPKDLDKALKEIYRCSKRYIWGYEYFSKKFVNVIYHKKDSLLWKGDYPEIFLDTFADLELVDKKIYPYLHNDNHDVMYLLQKKNKAKQS